MTRQAAADGRPSDLTHRGRATRGRIIAAAAELMFEHGVAATSIEDIKRRAGVSSSQLYHYFADRQDLIYAVIAHQTEAVLGSREPSGDEFSSLEALEQWRDEAIATERARDCRGGCPIGSLAGELAEADSRAREDLAAGFAHWEEVIRLGLEAMRERGQLRADAEPDTLALATLASLQGGLLLTQLRRDPRPLQAALDTTLNHIRTLSP